MGLVLPALLAVLAALKRGQILLAHGLAGDPATAPRNPRLLDERHLAGIVALEKRKMETLTE